MTWLFVRFYLCVLIVLFLAWYIYGAVLRQRTDADLARVIVEAHGGGARLVAQELDAALPENREQVWKRLRGRFDYPVDMIALTDLPSSLQRQIRSGEDVACFRLGKGHCVVAALSSGSELVRLGPFPDYDLEEIEQALGGWMRLTADKLDAAGPDERQAVLRELKKGFDFPVEIVSREDLPAWPKGRIARGEDIVFYPQDPQPNDRWLAATPLSDGTVVIRFGPFPSFERIEQKAATTTLALVLLPAALAIALLVRPVARQLRRVEHAALTIAAGDLSARVDERRVRAARPLAQAFNRMASRTESLVRRYYIGRFDGNRFTPEHESKYRVHWGAYYASQCFSNPPDGRVVQIGWARKVTIRVLVDRPMYELTGGGGACYKTSTRRDMGQPIGKISLTAEGGSLTVESLKIHEMTSAWKK